MADTPGLEPGAFTGMGVQVPPPADLVWLRTIRGCRIPAYRSSCVAFFLFLATILLALTLSACAPLSEFSSSAQIERTLRQELSATRTTRRNTTILIGDKELFSLALPGSRHEAIFEIAAGQPKIFWDPNLFLENFPKSELGEIRIHPHGEEIAFTADLHLTGHFSLFVTSLNRQKVWALSYADTASFEWSDNGEKICSIVRINLRPSSLRCGDPYQKQTFREVFFEQDESAVLSLERTFKKAQTLLISTSADWVETSSVYFTKNSVNRIVQIPRSAKTSSHIIEVNPLTMVSSDDDGSTEVKQKVGALPWRTFYRSSAESQLIWAEPARSNDSFWLLERSNGSLSLRSALPSGELRNVAIPTSTTLTMLPGQARHAARVRMIAESPSQPPRLLEIDENSLKIVASEALMQDSEASALEECQLYCPQNSGLSIPLTFVRRKNLKLPGPILLEVYGAYGATTGLKYAPIWPLLNRGFTLATAQVRGSGYYGPRWHRAGVAHNKENSIFDLLACARFLKSSGQASSIILYARSAGGIVAASAAQREPKLFSGLILDNPFLDVRSYLYTQNKPLARYEYTEWGDPSDPRTSSLLDRYAPMPPRLRDIFPPTLLLLTQQDIVTPATDALTWADAVKKQLPKTQIEIKISQEGTHHSELDEATLQAKQAQWMRFALEHASVSPDNLN